MVKLQRPKKSSSLGVLFFLSLIMPLLTGCMGVGIALGAAGLYGLGPEKDRIRGDIDGTLSHDYQKVVSAAKAVIQELEFKDLQKNEDEKKSIVEFAAKTLQERSITVKVSKEGVNLTKVKVHMDIFGDRDTSAAVLAKIKQKLQASS
jgi:hypothetical protein